MCPRCSVPLLGASLFGQRQRAIVQRKRRAVVTCCSRPHSGVLFGRNQTKRLLRARRQGGGSSPPVVRIKASKWSETSFLRSTFRSFPGSCPEGGLRVGTPGPFIEDPACRRHAIDVDRSLWGRGRFAALFGTTQRDWAFQRRMTIVRNAAESQKRWATPRRKLRFWYEPGPEKHQNKNIDQKQSTGVGSGQSEEPKRKCRMNSN